MFLKTLWACRSDSSWEAYSSPCRRFSDLHTLGDFMTLAQYNWATSYSFLTLLRSQPFPAMEIVLRKDGEETSFCVWKWETQGATYSPSSPLEVLRMSISTMSLNLLSPGRGIRREQSLSHGFWGWSSWKLRDHGRTLSRSWPKCFRDPHPF